MVLTFDVSLICRSKEALGSCISISGPLLNFNHNGKRQRCCPILLTWGLSDDRLSLEQVKSSIQCLRKEGQFLAQITTCLTLGCRSRSQIGWVQTITVVFVPKSVDHAGIDAEMRGIAGKGHSMVKDQQEMKAIMTFWAKNLKAAPPEPTSSDIVFEIA